MEDLQRRRVAVTCSIVSRCPSARVQFLIEIGPSLGTALPDLSQYICYDLLGTSKHSPEEIATCYTKLGLTVLREGRHVASLGGHFQRNVGRLPSRGRGRLLRLVLFVVLWVPDLLSYEAFLPVGDGRGLSAKARVAKGRGSSCDVGAWWIYSCSGHHYFHPGPPKCGLGPTTTASPP